MNLITGGIDASSISDFYGICSMLSEEGQALLQQVRTFGQTEVTPVINHYWSREEFPFQLIPALAKLGIMGLTYQGYGCAGESQAKHPAAGSVAGGRDPGQRAALT